MSLSLFLPQPLLLPLPLSLLLSPPLPFPLFLSLSLISCVWSGVGLLVASFLSWYYSWDRPGNMIFKDVHSTRITVADSDYVYYLNDWLDLWAINDNLALFYMTKSSLLVKVIDWIDSFPFSAFFTVEKTRNLLTADTRAMPLWDPILHPCSSW